MKLCAIVVTYYPKVDEAVSNIRQYLDGVDHLIIWVNTPEKDAARHSLTDTLPMDKVTVMTTGKNEGISYLLNQAIAWAKVNGYTHLLTMDQDSEWVDFAAYRKSAESYEDKYWIMGPNINGWFGQGEKADVMQVSEVMTSGALYNLELFDRVGGFEEKLFIDTVDLEICFRAARAGFPTMMLLKHKLKHKLGQNIEKKFTPTGYSAMRRYFIIRNHLWVWRRYPDLLSDISKRNICGFIFKEPIKVVAQENDKWNKVYSTFKGVLHGLTDSLPKRK